jgi:hypothetical protein
VCISVSGGVGENDTNTILEFSANQHPYSAWTETSSMQSIGICNQQRKAKYMVTESAKQNLHSPDKITAKEMKTNSGAVIMPKRLNMVCRKIAHALLRCLSLQMLLVFGQEATESNELSFI